MADIGVIAPQPVLAAWRRVLRSTGLAVLQGTAGTILVTAEGGAGWRVARAAAAVALTVGAVAGLRRGARVRGWTAVLFGLVGVVVGAGIAPAHLSKTGLTVRGVAATVVALTGLALAVAGAVALVRAARGWRKLLALPAAAVVAQFVLLPLPQSIAATNVPPTSSGGRTPAAVGLAYEDVVLHTDDGVPLSAWYVPSANGAAVVLLHGAGSTRASVIDHAAVLAGAGYGVLLVDTRGHGASGGRAMDFGWYAVPDVGAAVSDLARRSDVDHERIGVVGLSMGGEQALTAAAVDARVRAVVAEGVGRRSPADLASLPGGVRGQVQRAVEWLTFTGADLLTDAAPPIGLRAAVARIAPRPVLLVAGRGEVDGARYYQAGAPASTELWALPTTGHTRGLVDLRAQWTTRVTEFLNRTLRR
ncbi:alpha/beta fold hydrolase [Asanoa sp. NPDC049518]|uniref:alpha/beta hydrolase n=1 Tax=unclassified Asanoa TaxID=2685164 RepID=UPI0034305E25